MSNPTKAAKVAPKHTISSAGTVAKQAVQKGDALVVPGLVVTATGQTTGRKQKLVYSYDAGKLALHPAKASGTQLKAYLVQLQAVFGSSKVMVASAVLSGLQANGVSNPKRTMRRSQRAGLLA